MDDHVLRLHHAYPDFSLCRPPVGDVADNVSARLDTEQPDGTPLYFNCEAENIFSRDGLHYEYLGTVDGTATLRRLRGIPAHWSAVTGRGLSARNRPRQQDFARGGG